MFLKRILPISIILLACLISFWRFQNPCIENVDKTYQNGWQGSFDIKVERIPETCSFGTAFAGANFIFSARQSGSNDWQEIITFRHDTPIDISSKNIRIVNDKIAFVFMGRKAAVTSDAGKTWNLWDAKKDIENWKGANYEFIEKINMSENGDGIMILDSIPNKNEPKELFTSNFGKTWKQTK